MFALAAALGASLAPSVSAAQEPSAVVIVTGEPLRDAVDASARAALVAGGYALVGRDRSDAALSFRAPEGAVGPELAELLRGELAASVLVHAELRPNPAGGAFFALRVYDGANPRQEFGATTEAEVGVVVGRALGVLLASPSPPGVAPVVAPAPGPLPSAAIAGQVVTTPEPPLAAEVPQACGGLGREPSFGPIAPGVRVVLGRHRPVPGRCMREPCMSGWHPPMDAFVGQTATVTQIDGLDVQECPIVRVDLDGGAHAWRIRDMTVGGGGGATVSTSLTNGGNRDLCFAQLRDGRTGQAVVVENLLQDGQSVPPGGSVAVQAPPGHYRLLLRTCDGHEIGGGVLDAVEGGILRAQFESHFPVSFGISINAASGAASGGGSAFPGFLYSVAFTLGVGLAPNGMGFALELAAGLLHPWLGNAFYDPLFFGYAHFGWTHMTGGTRSSLVGGIALFNDAPLGSFAWFVETGSSALGRIGLHIVFNDAIALVLLNLGGGFFVL